MRLNTLIEKFLVWCSKNRSAGTTQEYQRHLRRLLAHAGNIVVANVKAHHLTSWATSWHDIQACQRLFNWACHEAELVNRNPFSQITKPRVGGRTRILDRRTMSLLFRKADADFRNYLLALRETIARPQEMRDVTWGDIRKADETLCLFEALKTGRAYFLLSAFKSKERMKSNASPRIIPITPRLGRLLLRIRDNAPTPDGNVFMTRRGKSFTKEALRLRMRRLRSRVGLHIDKNGENICCYTLRHTMATYAVTLGVPSKLLSQMMGHQSVRTTERYMHIQVGEMLDAANTLSSRVRYDRLKLR